MVCFIAIAIMVGIIDWHDGIVLGPAFVLGFNRNAYAGNAGAKYRRVVPVIRIDCRWCIDCALPGSYKTDLIIATAAIHCDFGGGNPARLPQLLPRLRV